MINLAMCSASLAEFHRVSEHDSGLNLYSAKSNSLYLIAIKKPRKQKYVHSEKTV